MSLANLQNSLFLIAAGVCLALALVFVLRGLRLRGDVAAYNYGVARQETRHSSLVSFSRAALLFVLALILFGVYGLAPQMPAGNPTPTPTTAAAEPTHTPRARATATATPSATPTPEATATPTVSVTATATVSTPEATATPTPTITPTITTTTTPTEAVVNSPNGLWLREAPGGVQQLELLPDGIVLALLTGFEVVDGVEWQQVRSPAGNEGWVAAEFLIFR